MKTLALAAVFFLALPAQAEEKRFDWNDNKTWGAHPPAEEEMDPAPAQRAKKKKNPPAYDREPPAFEWGNEKSWGAHPPSEDELEEEMPNGRVTVGQIGQAGKGNGRDARCVKPNKSTDDCHYCTESARAFTACMQEKGPMSRRIQSGRTRLRKGDTQGTDPTLNPSLWKDEEEPASQEKKVDPAG